MLSISGEFLSRHGKNCVSYRFVWTLNLNWLAMEFRFCFSLRSIQRRVQTEKNHTAARRLCKCIAQSVCYVSQHRWSMTVGAMWKEFQAIDDRQHYCSIDVRSRKTFTDSNLHERRITSWIIYFFGCWCWNDAVYDENKIVQTIRPMTDADLTFFHFLSRANSQLPEERRTAAKHSPESHHLAMESWLELKLESIPCVCIILWCKLRTGFSRKISKKNSIFSGLESSWYWIHPGTPDLNFL